MTRDVHSRYGFFTSAAFVLAMFLASSPALAQYFGQNKVNYKTFHFEVRKTDHFDVYYYDAERDAAEDVARMAER